jgi:alcohol dehydrogenase class IV
MEQTGFGEAELETYRTDMANPAPIAGLASPNAFVGVSHAPSAPASASRTFMAAPGTGRTSFPAGSRRWPEVLGLGGRTGDVARGRLFERIEGVLDGVGRPRTVEDLGIAPDWFREALHDRVRDVFGDPSLRTNPRMPLIAKSGQLPAGACALQHGRAS